MSVAQPGVIAVTSIPGWPNPAIGLAGYCQQQLWQAGFETAYSIQPDGLHVSDVPTVTAAFATFAGTNLGLQAWQAQQQLALDTFFNDHFDLAKFIQQGTATTVTAANVGTFLATITNNYRSLKSQIAAATSILQVQGINVNTGWPSNP